MKCLRRPWIGLVVLGGLAVPSAAIADDPADADRGAVEALVKETVVRLDEAEDARYGHAYSEHALKRAKAALDQAEKTRIVSEIAVKEYLLGSYQQDVETAKAAIALAEEDLTRATNYLAQMEKDRADGKVPENQFIASQLYKKRTEVGLSLAQKKLDVLEKFTKSKTTDQLKSNVKKAEAEEILSREAWQIYTTAMNRANRRLADDGLTANESQAIDRLEDVLSLFDAGKAEAGRAKLAEAKGLWVEAQNARAKTRFQASTERVRAEAKRARASR